MNVSKPLFILLVAMFAILVIADGLMTSPDGTWENVLFAESRSVSAEDLQASGSAEDAARLRSAMQAQWDLAEFYLGKGDLDRAEKEYQRLRSDFPYDIDYGYRHDDAAKRLKEIAEMKRQRATTGRYEPPGDVAGEL